VSEEHLHLSAMESGATGALVHEQTILVRVVNVLFDCLHATLLISEATDCLVVGGPVMNDITGVGADCANPFDPMIWKS